MVQVFREVRRVLREDGTCWVNMGDGYNAAGRDGHGTRIGYKQSTNRASANGDDDNRPTVNSLKPKDLIGMPWRLAFALQADGWTLRSEIIWQKPNPMPESVTDRPTKSHEQIFLFSKAKWVGPEASAFSHISDEDARWIALLFDAEGNIVVKRSMMESGRTTYGLQVAFANTSRNLIDVAKNMVGVGSIHERPGKNAPMFYWQLTNIQASELMKRIYRFLIVKQRQARLGIYVQSLFETARTERLTVEGRLRGRTRSDHHTELLEKCWATMKMLNHFGTPDLSWVPEPIFGRWVSQPYYFDQEAVREPSNGHNEHDLTGPGYHAPGQTAQTGSRMSKRPDGWESHDGGHGSIHKDGREPGAPAEIRMGRNLRSVWTIPTQPFSDWTKTVRWVRVAMGDVSGGMRRITCGDCPVHGGQAVPVPTELCGQRAGGFEIHTGHNDSGLAQEQEHDSALTGRPYSDCYSLETSDLQLRLYEATANDRNTESRKTVHDPATTRPYTASARKTSRTVGTREPRGPSGSAERIPVSSILLASVDDSLWAGTSFHTVSKSTSSVPPGCICGYYQKTVQETSHFATFPEELVKRCILAGTSARGCCPVCGAPWERMVDVARNPRRVESYTAHGQHHGTLRNDDGVGGPGSGALTPKVTTIGWRPTCCCALINNHISPDQNGHVVPYPTHPCIVLDPFVGSGTTVAVAESLGRRGIGLELKWDYLQLAKRRCQVTLGLPL